MSRWHQPTWPKNLRLMWKASRKPLVLAKASKSKKRHYGNIPIMMKKVGKSLLYNKIIIIFA